MTYGKTWHEGRTVRHHNLIAATQPPITGPIDRGKGRSNTAGKGKGKPKSRTEPAFWTEVTRVAIPTSTGSLAISVSGLSYTPKAARFIFAPVATDATPDTGAYGSVGATDGTNTWSVGFSNESKTRVGQTGVVVGAPNGGSLGARATFTSFNAGGCTLNFTTVTGAADLLTVEFYGGTAMDAEVGTFTPATTGNSTTVTTGFETNVLFTSSHNTTFSSTIATGAADFAGTTAAWDGSTVTQAFEYRNTTSSTVSQGYIRTTGSTVWQEARNFTSTSFDIRSNGANFSTRDMGYLAIGLGGAATAKVDIVDSPTSTGLATLGTNSVTPSFAVINSGRLTLLDTQQGTGEGFAWGISSIMADEQYISHWRSTDTTGGSGGTVDDFVEINSKAIDLLDHRSLNPVDAAFDSFVSGGARLNFTAVTGTALKWSVLTIG